VTKNILFELFLQIKTPSHPATPPPSSMPNNKHNSGFKIVERLKRFFDYLISSLPTISKSKEKVTTQRETGNNVNNSTEAIPKSIKVEKPNRKNQILQKAKDPSPKGTQEKNSKKVRTEDDSTYRSPPKKAETPEINYDMQIKTSEEFKKESTQFASQSSPSRQLDFSDSQEKKKLTREVSRLTKIETDLRKQIKDLEQHEDFTRDELDSVRKKELNLRSSLNREKEKRNEVESNLKREEESRKAAERAVIEERRGNAISELEQAKQRVRNLEIERESLREVRIILFEINVYFSL
jgi:chromosome segregation ATPase